MEIASKEYVDSKIVATGQRKTITLDLIPRCSKQSLYLMSYKDGGTSGDDLENADYYMDVGFEGTVKLEKIGGGGNQLLYKRLQ